MDLPRITHHPDGIAAVDAEYLRPGLAAVHVVQHAGRAAVIDTGSNHTVPRILAALGNLGLAPGEVDYVLLTHVHLDHAGGAGLLMRELPNARAVVHPRGAPHMVDPSKLIAGSMAVYGEQRYRELYGDILAIDRARVIETRDGMQLELAGRPLEFLHTPGHALHHQAIHDHVADAIFSGDTFGLSYRDLDGPGGPMIVATTTPTQFDPDQLVASIERLVARRPRAIYLTHYSRVTGIPELGAEVKRQVREFEAIARRYAGAPDRTAAITRAIRSLWMDLAKRLGCPRSQAEIDQILAMDLELNVQGLEAWLDRARR
jgi:glyoxylase-like metal-dependent hydrolase (beta-lactamase superfamily II)